MSQITKLDLKDRKIIVELEKDCRQNNQQLGKKVGLGPDVVRYRINRLEKNGIIAWHLAFVNFAKLGYTDYGVYVSTQHLTTEKEKRIVDFIQSHHRVSYVAKLGGKYDFIIGILARNILDFDSVWSEIMKNIGGHISNKDISTRVALYHFSKTYLVGSRQQHQLPSFGGEIMTTPIDETDSRILQVLSTNARMDIMTLASRIKVPASTTALRIKKLQQKKIIEGFFSFTRCQNYGFQNHIIFLSLQNHSLPDEQKIYRYCQQHPNIVYIIKTVGKWDYELSVEVQDLQFLQTIISGLKENFTGILANMEIITVFDDLKYNLYPF